MSDKQGIKYDSGKLRYDLIPEYSMQQLAKVYTFGCGKYDDWNWKKGILYSRLIAALFRHVWSFVRGEDIDPESGLPHLSHAAWNCFSLLYFSRYRKDLDDRQKEVPKDTAFDTSSSYPSPPFDYNKLMSQDRQGQLVWDSTCGQKDSVGGAVRSDQADGCESDSPLRDGDTFNPWKEKRRS
jgi:hypothetical protein